MKDKLFWPILIGGGAVMAGLYFYSRTSAVAAAVKPGAAPTAPTGLSLANMLGLNGNGALWDTPQAVANAAAPFSGLVQALGLQMPGSSSDLNFTPAQIAADGNPSSGYAFQIPNLDFGS